MAWRVPSLNGRHRHKKGRNSKISVPITKPMTRRAWWALKKFTNLIWGPSYLFQTAVTTSKFDEIKKFHKPARSQEPEVYPGLWNFWKISFLAWVMNDTVWSQIVVLFGQFLHHSVFFLVFTVFTSIMNFFLQFPFNPPSKIRPVPPALCLRPFGPDFWGGLKLCLWLICALDSIKVSIRFTLLFYPKILEGRKVFSGKYF